MLTVRKNSNGAHGHLVVVDVERTGEGIALTVRTPRRRLTLPRGGSATCPVLAVGVWLELSGIGEGPLFQSVARNGVLRGRRLAGGEITRIVKEAACRAGLDPTRLSAHSLRANRARRQPQEQ
jgi:integrase